MYVQFHKSTFRYLGMASIQSVGALEMTHIIKLPIIFSFFVGMLSYMVTGCLQITYPLPQECSHALASSGPHRRCSSINFLQERPVCELQSIEDIVALRRNVFMAGMQLVCFADTTYRQMIISEICVSKALTLDALQRLFLSGSNNWQADLYRPYCKYFRIFK